MSDKIEEIKRRHCQLGDSGLQRLIDRAYLLAEVERLTRERDEARDEVERLRDGLECLVCGRIVREIPEGSP